MMVNRGASCTPFMQTPQRLSVQQTIYPNQSNRAPSIISKRTLSSPEGVILTLFLASCDENLRTEPSWPWGWGGYYDYRGIWLQLVSVQFDVPVLPFTFLCCVVILATLISVLHFILTSKGNMLVKFHWISRPFPDHPVWSVLFGTSWPLWLLLLC